ncbi:hypothetical protein ART_3281 [Arthrobacter sp. PAMC 25486]|nr:hypothetical protein ART_3281 [Arthrobacter sp. PAMC 25486]
MKDGILPAHQRPEHFKGTPAGIGGPTLEGGGGWTGRWLKGHAPSIPVDTDNPPAAGNQLWITFGFATRR